MILLYFLDTGSYIKSLPITIIHAFVAAYYKKSITCLS